MIGWAFDSTGAMAPFDGPALAAAQFRVKQINAKGGVDGRQLQIKTCDTQGNKPRSRRRAPLSCSAAARTSSSRPATSTTRRRSSRRRSTTACSRSRRASAPTRWGRSASARRASSPSASATSRRTRARPWRSTPGRKGWRTAALATDGVIVYFKDVVQAFKARFTQLGGKIVDQETYHSLGGNDVQNVDQPARREEGGRDRHVDCRRVRRARDAHLGAADARQQHADPQLVGRRRHVLAAEEPAGDELLLRHVRVDLRRRPERGRQQAREAGQAPAPAASSPARPRSTAS